MSIDRTKKLDNLFDKWVETFPSDKKRFHRDGIICEDVYEKQKTKLLFIAKEPNNPDDEMFDFREWWREEVKYAFAHRICEWAYGCLNEFPPLTSLPYDNTKRVEVIRKIAFMNLKKTGGGGQADKEKVKEVVRDKQEKKFLLREIDIITPDVIIAGIGFDESLWDALFDGIEFVASGYDIGVA